MKYLKAIQIPAVAGVASVLVFLLANSAHTFGVLFNRFFPCEQNPGDSFPCYGLIDVGVMGIATLSFVLCIIWALVQLLLTARK